MLKIVLNNPYRFFGVCSNAPLAERVANSHRLSAFLKVNREVSFPLDLVDFVGAIERNSNGMNAASNSINLPVDQLKYALFWFLNASSIDKMALEYLQNGNAAKASELLEKKETFSSLINLGVLAFIQGNNGTAIQCITKVIHDEDYRKAFVEEICGKTFQISEEDLASLFIGTLLEEFSTFELKKLFEQYGTSSKDDDILGEKAVQELIAAINEAIFQAKGTEQNDSNAQYLAGLHLMESTKEDLQTIRAILGSTDPQYKMVADSLATQILQCGIYYYNKTKEDDDIKIDKAFTLQNYALSIAVGKLTKDRCQENVNILNEKKQELPPKEVRYYDTKIKEALVLYTRQPRKISVAIDLIKKVVPYLMSIKEVLSQTNPYYLKLSTKVVNASLNNIIEEFNSFMQDKKIQIALILDRQGTIDRVKDILTLAWKATLYMDKLDMEPGFRTGRYNQNRETLKNQVEQMITTRQTVRLDMRGERAIFNDCQTLAQFNNFLKIFPGGKYSKQAKSQIERIEFEQCKTTQDCQEFQNKYPNSSYDISGKWEVCYFNQCKTLSDYKGYLRAYPQGKHSKQAKLIIEDEEMWQQCISSKSKEMYKEYLAKHPDGRHKTEAEKKANACYIATMVYGDYNHPQVLVLRAFRDNTLQNSAWGRAFIRFYYRNSPSWAEKMQGRKVINSIIRFILDKFINLYKK